MFILDLFNLSVTVVRHVRDIMGQRLTAEALCTESLLLFGLQPAFRAEIGRVWHFIWYLLNAIRTCYLLPGLPC